ncbi:MAG: FAD-binding protein [Chloroflexaceae bacterium]|nr:FAD-binding protein [Chloroflexaceae bacterium]
MQTNLSRRSFIKAVASASLVVGFQAASGTWVTAAHAAEAGDFAKLPPLDGTLHLDEATRNEYAQDFGQIVHEQPLAVLKPGSPRDISRVIRFARRNGIPIVGRGKSHTTFGQSQVQAGLVIDMSTLASIHAITDETITVDAGMRWYDLLKATLEQGLMPPVLPDYIGQTVGGTLSVGGIGGMSFKFGAQIDHVLELTVITGTGAVLRCSLTENRDLFETVLAGQGQVAVIVQAVLRLMPAPTNVRLYDLFYADLPTMMADLNLLMEEERFDQMEGWLLPQPNGGWAYLLEVIAFHAPDGPPDDATLLAGLHHVTSATQTADLSFWAWASRIPLDFPKRPRPWIDLFLPGSTALDFLGHVQATLRPLAADDRFSVLLIPMRPARSTRPLFRVPNEAYAFGFDILRTAPNDPAAIEAILAYNRELYDKNRAMGGTNYPISAVRLTPEDWQRHYGPEFPRLLAARHRYDPDNVFASGPDMFRNNQ